MAIKWNPFDFLNKKMTDAEMETVMQKLTEQLAFKEMALFIGISYIANTLSKCEFKTYEEGAEEQVVLYVECFAESKREFKPIHQQIR